MIVPLNFPKAPLKLVKKKDVIYVTCLVRKKLVKLTPEEWVRQHVIHYLIAIKKASIGLMAVEKSISFNGLEKRFDIVVADHFGKYKLLIECKATSVDLSEETVFQLAQYNAVLSAEYVMITNGIESYAAHIDNTMNLFTLIDELPDFDTI